MFHNLSEDTFIVELKSVLTNATAPEEPTGGRGPTAGQWTAISVFVTIVFGSKSS